MRDLVRLRLDAVYSPGTPSALRVFAAPRAPLWAAGLDQAASPLAGRSQVRPGGPSPHHLVLEDYIAAVEAAEARRDQLPAQIAAMLPDWTLAPVVVALQTLMAYLGLVPSEHSSGISVGRGGITKAGNIAARRPLIEAVCARWRAGQAVL
jgi:transposase